MVVHTGLEYVSRDEWGALPPIEDTVPLAQPLATIVITHTPSYAACNSKEACAKVLRKMQRRHTKRHIDILYNFLIGGDGQIYVGTGFYTNGYFAKPAPVKADKKKRKKEESFGIESFNKTVLEVIEEAAEHTVEVTRRPLKKSPWTRCSDDTNGHTLSIAYIGDYSNAYPQLASEVRELELGDPRYSQTLNPAMLHDDLELPVLQLIAHGVRIGYVDQNTHILWHDERRWQAYLKESLTLKRNYMKRVTSKLNKEPFIYPDPLLNM